MCDGTVDDGVREFPKRKCRVDQSGDSVDSAAENFRQNLTNDSHGGIILTIMQRNDGRSV